MTRVYASVPHGRRRPRPPAGPPFILPTCPDCGQTIDALVCGYSGTTQASHDAMAALLLAVHRKLAHEPDTDA